MKKYYLVFINTIQKAMTYRMRILTYALMNALTPGIMIIIWTKHYGDGRSVGNFTLPYLVTYYSIMVVVSLFISKVEVNVKEDIKEGELANFVIRPFNYIKYRFFWEIAWYVVKIGLLGGPFLGALFLAVSRFDFPFLELSFGHNLFFGIVSTLLAYVLSFMFSMIIGSAAFFITEISGLDNLYAIATQLFTGAALPLDFFPEAITEILKFTPFNFMASFPVRVFLGDFAVNEIWQGLGIQIGWIVIGYLIYRFMWKMGIKKFSAVGL
jgi:ABC-2 type transport system permease protein